MYIPIYHYHEIIQKRTTVSWATTVPSADQTRARQPRHRLGCLVSEAAVEAGAGAGILTCFHQWGYPNSWLVYKGKCHLEMDDLGIFAI